jgi:hypothetical protein
MAEHGRSTGTADGRTGTGTGTPGKRPKNRDGPAKARGGWPKIIDFPIRGTAQNLGGLPKQSVHLIPSGIIPIGTKTA